MASRCSSACGQREAPGSPTRQPRWGGPPEGSAAKPRRRARVSGGGAPRAVKMFARLAALKGCATAVAAVVSIVAVMAQEPDRARTEALAQRAAERLQALQ